MYDAAAVDVCCAVAPASYVHDCSHRGEDRSIDSDNDADSFDIVVVVVSTDVQVAAIPTDVEDM